jgi:hypothetical protein
MNPVVCMESRVSNVLESPSYQNDKGRHQARVSIPCAREFVRELLDLEQIEKALHFTERIFAFAKKRALGCAKEGFRPIDALVIDPRLPKKFDYAACPSVNRLSNSAGLM